MIPIESTETALAKHWDMVGISILNRIKKVVKEKGELSLGKSKNRRLVKASPNLLRLLTLISSEDNLKWYLHLKNGELKTLIEKIENHLPSIIERRKKIKTKSVDYQIVYSIFFDHGYDHNNFSKLTFIQQLDIHTCPYCNRNYTYYLTSKGIIKPEIDHFYPKKIYPFLAASFYNLIPSCQTCNGFGGKGELDTFKKNVTSPYLITHDDFEFNYSINSISIFNPINTPNSIKIKFLKGLSENIQIFKLNELYEKHEDHVLELIFKGRYKYSEQYRKYLKSFENLGVTDNDINRLIIGNYVDLDSLHKRPLSKLYLDIAKKEGLI